MKNKVLISPSILSANFACLNEEIASIEAYADSLHVDIMDGHFVPNLTFGAPVLRCVRTRLPLECHLMVEKPENYVKAVKEAGAASFTFHVEATKKPYALIQKIRKHKMRVGASLKPKTPVSALKNILKKLDLVLVMSVEPGFGGQKFMPVALQKIRTLRALHPKLDIAVDGGINAKTAAQVRRAGANILVAGSYIFDARNRRSAIEKLRS